MKEFVERTFGTINKSQKKLNKKNKHKKKYNTELTLKTKTPEE